MTVAKRETIGAVVDSFVAWDSDGGVVRSVSFLLAEEVDL